MAFALVLGFLLPPTVNLNHFRVQFSESLSRSLGRPVSIQDVRLRLLPLPGFTFRQLRISDDYEFGAEPILQTFEEDGQRSVATLRVSSLWRGRFEIASISLTQASLNIVRCADGHWNLERLVNRAAAVPSAPTDKKQPETRTRFPYIELNESRINFKFGAEKKPFALSDADFALWLATENRWNVRLKAIPLRTDERVTDTGSIKVSGSFDRAPQFSKTPFHLQVTWERPEVSAITLIARGHDPGWRGAVELNSELKGTPADFTAKLIANIDEFRRYDIARNTPFNLRLSCDNHFRSQPTVENVANKLEFNCRLPLESGVLMAQGELHPLGQSPNVAVRLFASKVPVSSLIRAVLHAKSTLPDDLNGDGVIDGVWSIERTAGMPVNWNGAAKASNVVIQSRVLDSPLAFPRMVSVNFTPAQPTKARRKLPVQATGSRAVVEPFLLDLGGKAQLSASFDSEGYRIDVNGPVEWQRLMQAGRMVGLNPPATNLHGAGTITVEYSGEWQHFAPPSVSGQAQIHSAVLSLRGFAEPLTVASGSLEFDSQSVHVKQIRGSFPDSEFTFSGNFSAGRQCEEHLLCNATFDLQTDNLNDGVLAKLLNASSRMSIPFFNSARQFEAKWLLDVPCDGTITAHHLNIRDFHAQNVSAQLQLASGEILVEHWTAEVLGGTHVGEMAFDFSGPRPTISATGALKGVRMEDVYGELEESPGTGNLEVDYRLTMNGRTLDELASSASGSGAFTWRNGEIKSLHSDGEDARALNFAAWTGHFTVEKRRIGLQNTRMISTSGVREVSGQISFNREWNLKFVRANGSGFIASGTISNPTISIEPAKLAEAR